MADIISIADRRGEARRSLPSTSADTDMKAEILLFTGIRYERLEPQPAWTRVELPTLPALPSPAAPA